MATLPKPAPTSHDEQMLRAIPDEYVRHHVARNIDKLLSLYTDDARVLMPFHPISQGKNSVRKMLEMSFEEYDQKSLMVETDYVEVFGDAAYSVGSFKVNVKLPSGKRIDDQGKWLVTFRRAGNNWKMAAHCWNTDLPFAAFAR